jgi:hypothetical protein
MCKVIIPVTDIHKVPEYPLGVLRRTLIYVRCIRLVASEGISLHEPPLASCIHLNYRNCFRIAFAERWRTSDLRQFFRYLT